jgi:hypothetical protein
MSIEFEDLEEPLSLVGSLVVMISSFILVLFGALVGFPILGGNQICYDHWRGYRECYADLSIGYSFFFIFIVCLIILILSLMSIFRNKMKFKINVFVASVVEMVLFIFLILSVPGEPVQPEITTSMVIFTWIGVAGIAVIFVSKRPNLGKESNKHLYQAYGGFLTFSVGAILVILGVYVLVFDVGSFAGRGTFPGTSFNQEYIDPKSDIVAIYDWIRLTGYFVILGAIIICIISILRNLFTLYFSSVIILAGILTVMISVIVFFQQWIILDDRFNFYYPDEYLAQLKLQDPLVVNLGVVLLLLGVIGVLMIIYSAQQTEPIEKWKQKRNTMLAAAEVSIRDQKLPKAIKYLEQASIWSSKLGEEDRAVELITRINNIKEKAIKMRKAQAADKKKKELEAAKKKAEAKAPKTPPGKA